MDTAVPVKTVLCHSPWQRIKCGKRQEFRKSFSNPRSARYPGIIHTQGANACSIWASNKTTTEKYRRKDPPNPLASLTDHPPGIIDSRCGSEVPQGFQSGPFSCVQVDKVRGIERLSEGRGK